MNKRKKRILFITARATHYNKFFFEELSKIEEVKFLFDTGVKRAANRELSDIIGDYKYSYLKTIKLLGFIIPLEIPKLFYDIKKSDLVIKGDQNPVVIILALFFCYLQDKPILLWFSLWKTQTHSYSKLKYLLMSFILQKVDGVICYGTHVKEYLIDNYGIEESNLFIEHHSTRLSKSKKNHTIDLEKIKIPVLLFVGRLNIQKGIYVLLEAINQINFDFELWLIGNGPEESNIKSYIERNNLVNKVRIFGFIEPEALHHYYSLANIFILPSITTPEITETWGFVINEAMEMGLPIITTSAVGAAAGGLVQNGFNGIVVKEKSEEQLRSAIELLLLDNELRNNFGQNSLTLIKKFTPEIMAKDFSLAINTTLQLNA